MPINKEKEHGWLEAKQSGGAVYELGVKESKRAKALRLITRPLTDKHWKNSGQRKTAAEAAAVAAAPAEAPATASVSEKKKSWTLNMISFYFCEVNFAGRYVIERSIQVSNV